MKRIFVFVLLISLIMTFLPACSSNSSVTSTTPASTSGTPSTTTSTTAAGKIYNVAVIVKGTSSDYWQTVISGAVKFAKDNEAIVKVTSFGPETESDAGEQVEVIENVIATKPDAIVIAPTSSDAPIEALAEAQKMGIKVIVIDTKISSENYDSFLATDNHKGGMLAAKLLVDTLKAKGIDTKGKKVGFVAGTPGTESANARDGGFLDGMKEYAPEIAIVGPKYSNNVVEKALSIASDIISAEKDNGLVGLYANNNLTGGATLVARKERDDLDKNFVFVGFDSSAELLTGMTDGFVQGLVQQDPWGMGFYGVETAVKLLNGESVERSIDTGVTGITPENLNNTEIQALLDPTKR